MLSWARACWILKTNKITVLWRGFYGPRLDPQLGHHTEGEFKRSLRRRVPIGVFNANPWEVYLGCRAHLSMTRVSYSPSSSDPRQNVSTKFGMTSDFSSQSVLKSSGCHLTSKNTAFLGLFFTGSCEIVLRESSPHPRGKMALGGEVGSELVSHRSTHRVAVLCTTYEV